MTIINKDDQYLFCSSEDFPVDELKKVDYHTNDHTIQTAEILSSGRQINVVSFFVDKEDVIHPVIIILEPDYLMDVSRLVSCVKPYNLPFEESESLGIIVPFRHQIALVRSYLMEMGLDNIQHIIIDTVERFQGSQRDIIIYDTTISEDYELQLLSEPVEVEGSIADRKLNVALTRARQQLFIVGSRDLLSQSPLYSKLLMSIPNYSFIELSCSNG